MAVRDVPYYRGRGNWTATQETQHHNSCSDLAPLVSLLILRHREIKGFLCHPRSGKKTFHHGFAAARDRSERAGARLCHLQPADRTPSCRCQNRSRVIAAKSIVPERVAAGSRTNPRGGRRRWGPDKVACRSTNLCFWMQTSAEKRFARITFGTRTRQSRGLGRRDADMNSREDDDRGTPNLFTARMKGWDIQT